MNPIAQQLLDAYETHNIDQIRAALDAGIDPNTPIPGRDDTPPIERDQTPMQWLTTMYTRSPRFSACVRTMLDAGGRFDDPILTHVLLDDADALAAAIDSDASILTRRSTLVCAFTPLIGATYLHIAAEFGLAGAARALVELGADPNARADFDAHGLNGHTPIFHTVNAHANHAKPILQLLLDAGAAPDLQLRGITWGKGLEWETTFFDVTPISYAQMGLMPQVHRTETDIYANIKLLLSAAGRDTPPLDNVPNRYVQRSGR